MVIEDIDNQTSLSQRKNLSTLGSKKNRKDLMDDRKNYFSEFGIILTEKCNIKCKHCIFNCHPDTKTELNWLVIERIIKEAAATKSITNINFTGGEPFLELDTLVNAVNLCNTLGLKSSVVTNGFWAVSENVAKHILKKLNGLVVLNVSTDSFHQEFISIDRIRNVILSGYELGIDIYVRISYLNDPVSEIEYIKKQLIQVEGLYKISQQPVVSIGRAASNIDKNSIFSYDPTGIFCRGIDTPLIVSNGDVLACCSHVLSDLDDHPLLLGNIYNQSLEEIKNAADINPVIHALRLWGPSELVHLVQEQAKKDGCLFIPPLKDEVHNLCSLCKYIVNNQNYIKMLMHAIQDPDVLHEIAVGRLMELGEVSMILKEK
jgi:organic radical activating enzyme